MVFTFIGFLTVLLSITALYLAYRIYKLDVSYHIRGRTLLWKVVVAVLGFVVLRRITAFMIESGAMQNLLLGLGYGAAALNTIRPLQVLDRIIDPFVVDVLLVW